MDETNNYRLWEDIHKIMYSTYFYVARNKILPSLIPVNSHIKPTNDDPVLKYLPGLWKFKAMNDDVLDITVLLPGLILH